LYAIKIILLNNKQLDSGKQKKKTTGLRLVIGSNQTTNRSEESEFNFWLKQFFISQYFTYIPVELRIIKAIFPYNRIVNTKKKIILLIKDNQMNLKS